MKPSEILQQTADQENVDPDTLAVTINHLLEKKLAIVMQENDTVFLIIRLGDGIVELHIYTLDPPDKLTDSLSKFMQKLKSSEIKKIYGVERTNTDVLDTFQEVGLPIEQSDLPKYKWSATLWAAG